MAFGFTSVLLILAPTLCLVPAGRAQQMAQQQPSPSSSSSSAKHARKTAHGAGSKLDLGSVSHGVYRNPGFGFTCKLPAGWVLRTEEMNATPDGAATSAAIPNKEARPAAGQTAEGGCPRTGECVLLAAFARPPQARGEDVNSSILIATEPAAAYPGLTEAAQYFAPVTEIAKAQGFELINEPYEFVVGTKSLVRADFQKDVGTRVMWQSTLVVLAQGYAVSFTFIGGTEDEVEELIAGLSFDPGLKSHQPQ